MSERPMHTVPGAFQKLQQLYAEGEAALGRGDLETAVEKFTEGLGIDDHFRQRYITMYAQRAFALQKLGRLREAIDDYTRALALNEPPENQAQYLFHRGLAWQSLPAEGDARRANVEQAIADYGASIALFQRHPGPYHLRGKLLVNELEHYAEALPDLERALEFGENGDARALRGWAHFQLGKLDDAHADFTTLQASGNAYGDYMLAAIAAKRGDVDALVTHAQAALAADASYKPYFASDADDFEPFRKHPRFAALLR